mgnify:CR=1 FL=1|jgi:hypothetical protein
MKNWLTIILTTTLIAGVSYPAASMQCMDDIHPLSIRYLGVGALDIHYKEQRILTDPFYSPQTLWNIVTLDKYRPNPKAIKDALGPYQKNVDAVLVGHGHYDHLADLPAIKNFLKDDAVIVSSISSSNMIAPVYKKENRLAIQKKTTNQWHHIANGWVRVKAELSEHAPQVFNYNFASSTVDQPRSKLPRYIWSWKQGKNLSFMVDFLSEAHSNKVYKRIFIQTSASNFPMGYQPVSDGIQVDSIFVAAASFDNVDNYPTGLLKKYQPKETFLIHWENFFKPWFQDPSPMGTINFNELMNQSKEAHSSGAITVPNPKDCIYL